MLISNSKSDAKQSSVKIDWRPFMNPVSSQEACGSCWAFSTIHAIEGNYNVQFGKGKSPAFSQQQLVSCDTNSHGCQGGWPTSAMKYANASGLAFYNDYPYISGSTQKAETCRIGTGSIKTTNIVTGYDECVYGNCPQAQQRTMLAKGPLSIYIDGDGKSAGNSIFQHYKGGVLEMPCIQVNHAVVLTGVDSDDKGEYLIGTNSWGSGWGENGHFRMRSRPSDQTCFMESFGALVKVQENHTPVPPPPVPGCLKIYSKCGFNGDVREICGNTPTIDAFPTMAGFDIGKFQTVKVFFQQQTCQGSYYTFNQQSISCFNDNGYAPLNNNILSIIVDEQMPPASCVWFFEGNCLSGNKIEICTDVSDLNAAPFNFGNKTSSFKLGANVAGITIYLDVNFGGSYTTVNGNIYGLEGTWLNKDIESVKILRQ